MVATLLMTGAPMLLVASKTNLPASAVPGAATVAPMAAPGTAKQHHVANLDGVLDGCRARIWRRCPLPIAEGRLWRGRGRQSRPGDRRQPICAPECRQR